MKKRLSLFLLSCLLIAVNLKSQVLPVGEIEISLVPVVEQEISDEVMDTLTDPFYLIQQEASLKIGLNLSLQDTTQMRFIHIKLGTTSGGSELIDQSFNYDGTNMGAGLSYTRNYKYITLELGIHANTTNALYYAEVELEDVNGSKSTVTTTDTSQ
jgi:hypothetical protein